jgi:hypothetical protein
LHFQSFNFFFQFIDNVHHLDCKIPSFILYQMKHLFDFAFAFFTLLSSQHLLIFNS